MNCVLFRWLPDRRHRVQSGLIVGLIALAGSPLAASEKGGHPALPSGFVYLRDVDATIQQDIRYASANNFTGKVLPGYKAAECVIRSDVAKALKQAQAAFVKQGYSLKVYDCYRPDRAVKAFGVWARNLKDQSTKHYYPRLPKSGLYGKGYIASRSTHSRGFAVDLTLVRLPAAPTPAGNEGMSRSSCIAPAGQRAPDTSIDMGTGFDCFDVLSHTDNPNIKGKQKANRQLLKALMSKHGFRNYRREWWHYSYRRRTYPRTYFNFPIRPHDTGYAD
jgi:D-alanyl-D-alanine dipeptidase